MSYSAISVLGLGLFCKFTTIWVRCQEAEGGFIKKFQLRAAERGSAGTKGGFAGGNSKKIAKMLPT